MPSICATNLRRLSTPLSILFILILSTSYATTPAQAQRNDDNDGPFSGDPEVTQFVNVTEKYPNFEWRLFSVNTTSPVARELRTGSKDVDLEKIQPAFDYIDAVWEVVAERRRKNDSRACNLYELYYYDWATIMKQRAEIYNVGEIDPTCFSQVDLHDAVNSGELSATILHTAREVFMNSHKGFETVYNKLKLKPDNNWSSDGTTYGMISRTRRRAGQTCAIASLFAHRKRKVWYLRGAVTNDKVDTQRGPYERQFLQEFVPRKGNESLRVPLYNIKDHKRMESATTLVENWGGRGYSIEVVSFDDPISPLFKAYKRNLKGVDLAEDAITSSNIAILALPMTMNFIPLAFIADIHTVGMIAYVIVTDIFSAIPFIMKGFELIQSSTPSRQESIAFFSGNETLGTMQSWVVDCAGEEKFRNIGIAFVVVGFSAIFIGIALELWARERLIFTRLEESRNRDLDIDIDDANVNARESDIRGPFGNKYFRFYGRNRVSSVVTSSSAPASFVSPGNHRLSGSSRMSGRMTGSGVGVGSGGKGAGNDYRRATERGRNPFSNVSYWKREAKG